MYIGIDPGLSGACAVLATDGTLEAGVCVAMERICAAAHIRSYVEFRNMWSLLPGRPVTLYKRANLPRIFLAAFSIVKGMQSINFSSNLSPKTPFLREFAQFSSC